MCLRYNTRTGFGDVMMRVDPHGKDLLTSKVGTVCILPVISNTQMVKLEEMFIRKEETFSKGKKVKEHSLFLRSNYYLTHQGR